MPTSQTSSLSKPSGVDRIAPWELAYFEARNRSRVHELVLNEFQKSGMSQADLARRLNKQPAVISRLLGAPGNWGLDTISDLLFAISGAEVRYAVQYPLDGAARNYCIPDWLGTEGVPTHVVGIGQAQPVSGAVAVVTKAGMLNVSTTR